MTPIQKIIPEVLNQILKRAQFQKKRAALKPKTSDGTPANVTPTSCKFSFVRNFGFFGQEIFDSFESALDSYQCPSLDSLVIGIV